MRTATEVQRNAGQPHHHPPAPVIGGICEHIHPNELTYLSERRIGRLATADRNGRPHVVPAGFNIGDRDDCFGVGEVNQQALFGRVAAVEHHGGAGTTTAAYRTPIAAPAECARRSIPVGFTCRRGGSTSSTRWSHR